MRHRSGRYFDMGKKILKKGVWSLCFMSGTVDKAVHPYRTRKLGENSQLEPWDVVPAGTSSNRQSLDPCVILDGAARVMRVSSCFPIKGDAPFPYLGKTVLFEENPGGRDVHDEDDLILTEHYLKRQNWTKDDVPEYMAL